MAESRSAKRGWWRRRSFAGIRNGRLLVLAAVSLLTGAAATALTAYLGIR